MTQELTMAQAEALVVKTDQQLIDIRLDMEKYPHFLRLPQMTQYGSLRAILLNCYKLLHDKDISYIETDAMMLNKMILENYNYKNLTLHEIGEALTRGAVGRYGKCYKMTVQFCLESLDQFIEENKAIYLEAERRRKMAEQKQSMREGVEMIKAKYAVMMARAKKEREEQERERQKEIRRLREELLKNKD